jgi:predicted metal-dependent peptidase
MNHSDVDLALSKTIVSLIRKKPFYGHVLAQMSKHITDRVPTLAVAITNRLLLYVNPTFFMSLSENHRCGVLEHEVNHVTFLHVTRGRNFSYHSVANIAMDIIVNQFIERNDLPKEGLLPEQFGLAKNETLQYYYDKLLKKMPKVTVKVMGQGKRQGKGQSQGQSQGQKGESEGQGKEKRQKGEGDRSGDEGQVVVTIDSHDQWGKDEKVGGQEGEIIASDVIKESIIKECIRHAKEASHGDGIGDMAGAIEELLKPPSRAKLPWKVLLRRFLSHATRTTIDYTKKRVSKRYKTRPGIKLGSVLDIAVAIDTSGSISSEDLQMFSSEVREISRSGTGVTIIECDADIQRIYELKNNEIITEVHGRGGTDFRPVFEYLDKPRNKKDALVFFTDSQGPAPDKSRLPTLWVLTHGNKRPAPFGLEVELPKVVECDD